MHHTLLYLYIEVSDQFISLYALVRGINIKYPLLSNDLRVRRAYCLRCPQTTIV